MLPRTPRQIRTVAVWILSPLSLPLDYWGMRQPWEFPLAVNTYLILQSNLHHAEPLRMMQLERQFIGIH